MRLASLLLVHVTSDDGPIWEEVIQPQHWIRFFQSVYVEGAWGVSFRCSHRVCTSRHGPFRVHLDYDKFWCCLWLTVLWKRRNFDCEGKTFSVLTDFSVCGTLEMTQSLWSHPDSIRMLPPPPDLASKISGKNESVAVFVAIPSPTKKPRSRMEKFTILKKAMTKKSSGSSSKGWQTRSWWNHSPVSEGGQQFARTVAPKSLGET